MSCEGREGPGKGTGAEQIGSVLPALVVSCLVPKSTPDWMQALQELHSLVKKEGLQSWKSDSTKPSVVTWTFMNTLSSRRAGVVREGGVEKDFVWGEISMPSSFDTLKDCNILQHTATFVWGEISMPSSSSA